jgi:hypothetical protein
MKLSGLIHCQVKKSFLYIRTLLCFLLFTTGAFAQIPQEERADPPMEQLPQEQRQLAISYDDEIQLKELPAEIHDSVNENYPEHKIDEVFRGSDGSYKIKMEKGDKKAILFYSAGGNFLRLEETHGENSLNGEWQ